MASIPAREAASVVRLSALSVVVLASVAAHATPTVSRLTPPSELFSSGQNAPLIARFLPDQRFDLQATIRPDDASKTPKPHEFEYIIILLKNGIKK